MYSESMVSRSALVCNCRAPRVNSSSTLSSYHCPKSTGSKKKKTQKKVKNRFYSFFGGLFGSMRKLKLSQMKNGVQTCWFCSVKFLTDISRRCWNSHTTQHQASSTVLVQAIEDILHTGLYIVHVAVGQHTVLVNQLEIKPEPDI